MQRSWKVALLTGAGALALGGCEFLGDIRSADPPSLVLQSGPMVEPREDILSELSPTRDLLMEHPDPEPFVVGPYTFHDRRPSEITAEFLRDIERAVADCDLAAYNAARERWINHGYDPTLQARRPDEAIDEREREDLTTLIRVYNERPRFPRPCPAGAPRVEIGAWGGTDRARLPARSFLGSEINAMPRIGFVSPERTDEDGETYGGWFEFPLRPVRLPLFGGRGDLRARLAMESEYYELDEDFDVLDVGPGARLLIPGPDGGATGFSLGGHPANLVTDGYYRLDHDQHGVRAELRRSVEAGFGRTTLSAGLRYGWGQSHEVLGGDIPGFGRDFAYETPVDLRQVQMRVGVELEGGPAVWEPMPAGSLAMSWRAFAGGGPDFNEGEGVDTLRFAGFPDTTVPISEDTVDWGGYVGGGLTWHIGWFSLGGEIRYERRTGFPVVERDGNDPSRLRLKGADSVVGTLRASYSF